MDASHDTESFVILVVLLYCAFVHTFFFFADKLHNLEQVDSGEAAGCYA